MHSHAPADYDCPFCGLVRGDDTSRSSQRDVVYRDDDATAFIGALWWPKNEGHVLVVPNEHVENIYAIADDVLAHVYAAAKKVALALGETYGCAGTSTRQHNEPGANQDVWHFHVHVFPRYTGDDLYASHHHARWTTPEERAPYAAKLRAYFSG